MSFSSIPIRENGTPVKNFWFNMLRTAGIALESGVLPTTLFTIANNVASPTNVTGLTLDGNDYSSAKIDVEIYRSTDTPTELMTRMELFLTYKPTLDQWDLTVNERGPDDTGVEFTVTTTTGIAQIKYTSSNLSGGAYSGTMKYFVSKM